MLVACAFVSAVLTGPRPSGAVEPDPHYFVRARSVVDAYQIRRLDGRVTQTRVVLQRLDLAATADGVIAVFGGSFAFDEGLRARPRAAESRERQLQPTLHRASVRWAAGRFTSVQAGRHDIVGSTIGLARLDGLSARAHFEAASFDLRLGIRPDDAIIRIDDASYLSDTERETRQSFGDHTGMLEISAEVRDRVGEARIGVRHEASIDGDFRDGTRIGVALRAGQHDRTSASGRVRVKAQTGDLERYDLIGATNVGPASIVASARGSAAVFPMDSIFSVFPVTRYDEQSIRLSVGDDLSTSLRAIARASGAEQAERVRTFGGAIDLTQRHPMRTDWSLGARLLGGDRGGELRTMASIAAEPSRGPRWRASHVFSRRTVRHTGLERIRVGTFARLGAHWRIDDWSDLAITTDTGWDDRNRASFRLFATADISLPGGPS